MCLCSRQRNSACVFMFNSLSLLALHFAIESITSEVLAQYLVKETRESQMDEVEQFRDLPGEMQQLFCCLIFYMGSGDNKLSGGSALNLWHSSHDERVITLFTNSLVIYVSKPKSLPLQWLALYLVVHKADLV